MNKISQIFSTLFFIGYVKWAPGTFGSIFSLITIIFLHNIVNKNEFIILFICIFLMATICIKIYSKSVNKHDAKGINRGWRLDDAGGHIKHKPATPKAPAPPAW